jgi:hypothetical protein
MTESLSQINGIDSELFRHKVEAHYTYRGLTLPRVRLEQIGEITIFGVHFSVYDANVAHKEVGVCSIDQHEVSSRNQNYFSSVSIDDYPCQGYGVATYTEAICTALDQGKDFRTDPVLGLSEKSANMWRRFIGLRVAIELAPLIPATQETDIYWDVVVPAIDAEMYEQIQT